MCIVLKYRVMTKIIMLACLLTAGCDSTVKQSTSISDANGYFAVATRRLIAHKVFERLYGTERYAGKRFKLRDIIIRQAQRIATHLRGERNYEPFNFHYWD